jgi:hypothetical protein
MSPNIAFDNRAISSVNVLGNKIGIRQAQALAAILKEHSTLKSLCGHKGDETELNMSGKNIGRAGAIMLAPEIVDNGAISCLIGDNRFEAKRKFFKAALTCKHCGQQKDQHRKVGPLHFYCSS